MNSEQLKGHARRIHERWWTLRSQIVLAIAVAVCIPIVLGFVLARSVVQRGWPQTEGTLEIEGLSAPVKVVRDHHGVPHIYAKTESDLFFAQGFVHAQDRFWGMELSRRCGRGMLAPLLGDGALGGDEEWRNLDLAGVAKRELAGMDAATRGPLDAYAAGVNAWLSEPRTRLPFEFTVLSWREREAGDPAPWTSEDSLIVSLALSWQMGAPRIDPGLSERIAQRVGPERAAFLLDVEPGYGPHTFVHPALQSWAEPTQAESLPALPDRWPLSGRVTSLPGDQTENRQSFLAVDLPSGLGLPAAWYVMAWHVGDEGAAGASAPGLPGLVVGTGGAVSWEAQSETLADALGAEELPWKNWLSAAAFESGEIDQIDDPAARTMNDFQEYLMDTYSARAARLIPLLTQIEPHGWRQERVTGMLRKWDFFVGDNNKEAPFFAVYQLELARAAFADEMGDELFEVYVAQSDPYQRALDQIIVDPENEWWDDVTTPERELRDDILKRAYEPALEWIGRNYGDLHMLWEWDIVHGSRLHHSLGDVWPWDQLFNRDLALDGWTATMNASPGGLPCLGNICQGGDLFRAKAVYAYRQILDASDPSALWFTLLPGQSGHPFHAHYDDLLDGWLAGQYTLVRLAASPQEVSETESVLVLAPKD